MLKILLDQIKYGLRNIEEKLRNRNSLHKRTSLVWLLVACALFLLPISTSAQSASQPSEPESIFIDPKWECVPLDQFSVMDEFRQYKLLKSDIDSRYAIRSRYSRCPLVFRLKDVTLAKIREFLFDSWTIEMTLPELPSFIELSKEMCGAPEGKCHFELGRNIQKRGVVIVVGNKSGIDGAIVYQNTFSQ